MGKVLLILAVAVAVVMATGPAAHAGDDFEYGFKTELGAITARAAVGLGVGLVTGVVHGGHNRHYRPRHVIHRHGYEPYYGHGPRYSRAVIYRPYPRPNTYVQRRVYYSPPPRWCY